jgi:alpha-beta hydrolase superfamily lysophospholipase
VYVALSCPKTAVERRQLFIQFDDSKNEGNPHRGPDNLDQAGPTAWDDMTADIHHLADIARRANPGPPLIAFGHNMGSALTSRTWRSTATCWPPRSRAARWAPSRGSTRTTT